jgi:CRISPR-associated endonuclease/helicase Cas3
VGKILSEDRAQQWLVAALDLKPGEEPFPWQLSLLEKFRRGEICRFVDLPTGMGKTSVMAIWLVARALGSPIPRRLVYVVDRRAVVDQATQVAEGLRRFVDMVPEARETLGLNGRTLPISTLRGQFVDNREWLRDPTISAIMVGTIDMVGSRLLFEGYGVGRKMRPYHAGLMGADTLIVFDEAHLVPAFDGLLSEVASSKELQPVDDVRRLIPACHVMSLSATGRGGAGDIMHLGEEDRRHSVIQKRLLAPKKVTTITLTQGEELSEALARESWNLTHQGQKPLRCIIFCDSREVALKVKQELDRLNRKQKGSKSGARATVELFVGSRRVFERENTAKRLESLGFIAGKAPSEPGPVFLVATSAAEVGVDLDSDCMVCDIVAWERMVQRFGRVNRRGDVEGGARVIVVVDEAAFQAKKTQQEEAERKKAAFELLQHLENNASPEVLVILARKAEEDNTLRVLFAKAITKPPLRPSLTRALVDAWSMTSLKQHPGRPEIAPWLRGWTSEKPQTQVVWRAHLPIRRDSSGSCLMSQDDINNFFEAAPPHLSETLTTETFRVEKWLKQRCAKLMEKWTSTDDAHLGLRAHDICGIVLSPADEFVKALTVADLVDAKGDEDELGLTGRTLVVDRRLGGLTDGLLDNSADDYPDTADLSGNEGWQENVGFRIRIVSDETPPSGLWHEGLRLVLATSDEGDTEWLVVEKWADQSSNEDDRSTGSPQSLEDHSHQVAERVERLADTLALPAEYRQVLRVAALLHDRGKSAWRWQQAFNAPAGQTPYAKTKGPINLELLDHYRHELGSYLEAKATCQIADLKESHLQDLALHLIVSHHGFARPFVDTRGCDALPPSALESEAREVALRYARLQSLWGPWGLAWWEAVLRSADHEASRLV